LDKQIIYFNEGKAEVFFHQPLGGNAFPVRCTGNLGYQSPWEKATKVNKKKTEAVLIVISVCFITFESKLSSSNYSFIDQ